MSKIGRLPITLPSGVTATLTGRVVEIKGTKGVLSHTLPSGITLTIQDQTLLCERSSEAKPVRALHGTTRSLISNMVQGVSEGYSKKLELVGTGYRARLAGPKLVLSLGFSHEIEYTPPVGVTLTVEGTNLISVTGFEKQPVGQVAAEIRSFRKPEPYKGKGIRYEGEVVKKKAGKTGKTAAAA